MGVLETVGRIEQLGGQAPLGERVAALRAAFEARTGAFASEDPWFEERSRSFWCDAVTGGRFGREVEGALAPSERAWLGPLERAHRGLFRAADRGGRGRLVDAWSGAELLVTLLDDESRAELDAATGQLFDARVVAADNSWTVALLPGAIFHPRNATASIETVLIAARARGLATRETLDALLRMERTLRSLSRVKAGFAYRPEALAPPPSPGAREGGAVDPEWRKRRAHKTPT
jgi:hypothetical protein